jgi:2-polyprenyl-3-methyl-5-hydroxy-6-metoxy-1,4-benzoquinol methylase
MVCHVPNGLECLIFSHVKSMAMKLKDILDYPLVWYLFRTILDLTFGVDRKRKLLLEKWGIRGFEMSVLDVGCGIGQFSDITKGEYLGVDLNRDFVLRASKVNSAANVKFRCVNVKDLSLEGKKFEVVLLIGILHHLDESTSRSLLSLLKDVTEQYLVVMEVIQEQTNFLGRWIKDNDRGEFVRRHQELFTMIAEEGYKAERQEIVYLGPTKTVAALWKV